MARLPSIGLSHTAHISTPTHQRLGGLRVPGLGRPGSDAQEILRANRADLERIELVLLSQKCEERAAITTAALIIAPSPPAGEGMKACQHIAIG
jgi:hypothetical protein